MTVLIIAEHNHQTIASATLHAVSAANQLGDVHLLLMGDPLEDVIMEAKNIAGITQIIVAKAPHFSHQLAEELAPFVVSIAEDYTYIMATATAFGKNLLPRIAALLDVSQISDVTKILDAQTFEHPIYAGNALETVSASENLLVLTVRATAFAPAERSFNGATVVECPPTPAQNLSRFISHTLTKNDRPELTQARVVVSGGRGLYSKEQFEALLTPLAEVLNAAVGASRAAVDAGFAPNDYQVGQTGKIVAPEVYFAIGLSGAIQHLAGMKDSKVIVAINKDPDAPIFAVADFGLVADLFSAIPELVEALKG